MALSNKYKSFS